jgi:predicted phage terminase large subunit-like protein
MGDFMQIPSFSMRSLQNALARRNLLAFSEVTWDGFRANWHHKLICSEIDNLISDPDCPNLMIFAPPRHGKSQIVSRNLPAYYLGNFPDNEVMSCSYTAELGYQMAEDVGRIMTSQRYREIFPNTLVGKHHRPEYGKAVFKRDLIGVAGRRGHYRSAGVGGSIMGMGFHLGIIDDPIKSSERAGSSTERDKVHNWFKTDFYTRRAPRAKMLLIMTRWHNDDLAGRLLREQPGEWKVITLPGLSTGDDDDLMNSDPRRGTIGEPLWPEWWGKEAHAITRQLMGEIWYGAMYGQKPIPDGAGLFKVNRIGRFMRNQTGYWVNGVCYLHEEMRFGACMDLACSEKNQSDFTAMVFFAVTPHNHVCIDAVYRQRVSVNDLILWGAQKCGQHPRVGQLTVEANGMQVAVVRLMQDSGMYPSIVEVKPESKSKLARATVAINRMQEGKILLPEDPQSWEKNFVDELSLFTGNEDAHDDQVDALSYACSQYGYRMTNALDSEANEEIRRIAGRVNRYYDRGH